MMLTCTSQPWARISSTNAVTRLKRARGMSSDTSRRTRSSSGIEHAFVQALEVGIERLGLEVGVERVGHVDAAVAHDALNRIHGRALLTHQAGEIVAQSVERAMPHARHLEACLLVFV